MLNEYTKLWIAQIQYVEITKNDISVTIFLVIDHRRGPKCRYCCLEKIEQVGLKFEVYDAKN